MSEGEELKVYEQVCNSRFNRIESKLDSINNKLDNRLKPLEDFQSRAMGIIVLLSVVVPLAVKYFFKIG